MQAKNPVQLWRETHRTHAAQRDGFRSMHLTGLHQATRQQLEEQLHYIQFELQDFFLCELKGRPQEIRGLPLPTGEGNILWLGLHFQGTLHFPTGSNSTGNSIFSLSTETDYHLTISTERQWLLLLGIQGASQQQLLTELPQLRDLHKRRHDSLQKLTGITHIERQLLDQFAKASLGPFSTLHHIGLLIAKLNAGYLHQLSRPSAPQGREESLIQIYHQAVTYITENYMDADLNRDKIADICCCSPRQLNRAFAEHNNSLKSSILLIRLHRGKELLLRQPELSIEQIALTLYFFDAKHFSKQYKICFHRSPREERKIAAKAALLTSGS